MKNHGICLIALILLSLESVSCSNLDIEEITKNKDSVYAWHKKVQKLISHDNPTTAAERDKACSHCRAISPILGRIASKNDRIEQRLEKLDWSNSLDDGSAKNQKLRKEIVSDRKVREIESERSKLVAFILRNTHRALEDYISHQKPETELMQQYDNSKYFKGLKFKLNYLKEQFENLPEDAQQAVLKEKPSLNDILRTTNNVSK